MKNRNKIIFYLFVFVIITLFYFCLQINKQQEPFISYLNTKKNILSRNFRYSSQYINKSFNNYFNKIKKLLY